MTDLTTSRIPHAIDRLVEVAKLVLPKGTPITDGPVPIGDQSRYVIVGVDEVSGDADWVAATADQQWAALGHRAREETADVNGVLMVSGGGDLAKPYRDEAFRWFALLADAVRLGVEGVAPVTGVTLDIEGVWKSGMAVTRLRQIGSTRGIAVELSWTFRYWARI